MLEESDADDSHKRIERQKLEALLGFCEITTCRRQTMLAYFDDHLPAPCGNCDTCLEPPETWEGTEAAQKALSCAYRTGQRFGVNYLIEVLVGKSNDRIVRFGHDQLSTFGIGAELDPRQWRSVFRQLVARGLLTVDVEGYGSLLLTEESWPVLRGEQRIELRREQKPVPTKRKSRKPSPAAAAAAVDKSSSLWNALRTLRQDLARRQGVPPYVIFHDKTLAQMVELCPQTSAEFGELSGVGERKLARYADAFLAVIREHPAAETGGG